MNNAYAPATRETCGTGLLVFHVFCDHRIPPVPENQRGPANASLILSFVSCCATSSSDAVRNYVYGVKAWHTIHNLPWSLDENQLGAALATSRSCLSGCPTRPPVLVETISRLREHLNLNVLLDAAVFACLTTIFWTISCLGEFTVKNLSSFKPTVHVKLSNVTSGDAEGTSLPLTSIHLPFTKVAKYRGETVHYAPQAGVYDPQAAFTSPPTWHAQCPLHSCDETPLLRAAPVHQP